MCHSHCGILVAAVVLLDVCMATGPAAPGTNPTVGTLPSRPGRQEQASRLQQPGDAHDSPDHGRPSHLVKLFINAALAVAIVSENMMEVFGIVLGVLLLAVLTLALSPILQKIKQVRYLATSEERREQYSVLQRETTGQQRPQPGNGLHSYLDLGTLTRFSSFSQRSTGVYEEIGILPFRAVAGRPEETRLGDEDLPAPSPPLPPPPVGSWSDDYLHPV